MSEYVQGEKGRLIESLSRKARETQARVEEIKARLGTKNERSTDRGELANLHHRLKSFLCVPGAR